MEKIRDRIRKLLRVARDKGASENEAATAMAMASKLMLEHNIEHVGDEDESSSRVVKGQPMGVDRGDKWERVVASATAKLFNCRSIIYRHVGDHAFVGKPENIEACEMTFVWICEQIEELYKDGLKAFRHQVGGLNKSLRADFRRTFKEACAIRIYQRVGEIVMQNRGNIPSHLALVVIDQSLDEADQLLNASGVKKGRAMQKFNTGFGTGAGASAGDQVKLQNDLGHVRPTLKQIGGK